MRDFRWLLIALLAVALAGCGSMSRKEAVPKALTYQAVVPGLEEVRYRVGIDEEPLLREALASVRREQAYLASTGYAGALPPAVYLALSGGGDNGAFGAGLLNGWTVAGNRPEFKLVTGVSTGALIAPFAFLGPEYDGQLKHFYTTLSPADIMEPRGFIKAMTSDAMADNQPLWRLLEEVVDQKMLDAIAREYAKGRLLLVGTVDMDALQPVLWNMTRIAASRDPKALHLFRSVLMASTAIPVGFPPVMIDVQANGRAYQEMHVDGGAMAQVFVYPPTLKVQEAGEEHDIERERTLYVIRNARLAPEWASVERQILSIGSRTIVSLVQTQGIGALYRIYAICQRDGVDFNLAYIPASFNVPHREEFDTDYMRALFQTGYEMAAKGYPWEKQPPGY